MKTYVVVHKSEAFLMSTQNVFSLKNKKNISPIPLLSWAMDIDLEKLRFSTDLALRL